MVVLVASGDETDEPSGGGLLLVVTTIDPEMLEVTRDGSSVRGDEGSKGEPGTSDFGELDGNLDVAIGVIPGVIVTRVLNCVGGEMLSIHCVVPLITE